MDLISLRGIRAHGRHGNNPGERDHPQPFDVDLFLKLDLRNAQADDDLQSTVDYDALHKEVVRVIETTSYRLLERLAGELLNRAFADERIASAELTISKPKLLDGATPAVTLRRSNPLYRTAHP
ncbi:MAG: dihydroneopterin aldolase [Candidatus Eremiobacteraeota bacterium]|nr:dihydroneopterin aldolase [Candidatus Eremiobacteraeota bacterium]